MLEKDFQRQVIQHIKKMYPETWFTKVSDRFMGGVPDIVGCYNGRMFAIELKVGVNKPTKLQVVTMDKMIAAGAAVRVVNGSTQGMAEIDNFFAELKTQEVANPL